MFRRWNKFWFRSAPLLNLAVCRIIIVGYQLYHLLSAYQHYISAADLPAFLYEPLPILEPLTWLIGDRPGAGVLVAIFWLTFSAGVTSLVGFLANPSLWVFAIGNIFLQGHAYSYGEIHHPEALMMISLLTLAMSPAGKDLSVDDYRQRGLSVTNGLRDYLSELGKKKSEFAQWPLLFISALFGIIYLDAGLSKVAESGLDWANGYTLQYYLAQDALRWGSDLGNWLSQHHTLVEIMSWGALLFELTFFLVVIYPRLAFLYIPAGIAMHTVIYLTMNAPFFTFITLYSVFIPWYFIYKNMRHNATSVRSWK